jgi:hypothetical protein
MRCRRLQRERLRGPSRRRKPAVKLLVEPGGPAGGDSEPEGALAEEAEPDEDLGLLGDYEMEVMVEKRDAGVALYIVMAVEYLLSLERKCALARPPTRPHGPQLREQWQ